jgi:hypothetical protein
MQTPLPPHKSHSRHFASAFFTQSTAAEGRLCPSPLSRGRMQVRAAGIIAMSKSEERLHQGRGLLRWRGLCYTGAQRPAFGAI